MRIAVIGGGVVGAAVARVAARQGPVLVASRTERAHAGVWLRFELGRDRLPAACRQAEALVLALGNQPPVALRSLVEHARKEFGPGRLLVLGGVPDSGTAGIEHSPVWDLHERSIQPLLEAMRRGGSASLPRGLPARRWLWAEDLARVAVDVLAAPPATLRVQGPTLLDAAGLARALEARERGHCGTGWRRSPALPPDPAADDWDDSRWGTRRRV